MSGTNNKKITYVDNPKAGFGELQVANLTPVIQWHSPYGVLNNQLVETFLSNGTVTVDGGLVTLANQNGVGDYATLMSIKNSKYKPGEGNVSRFTCMFNEGVSTSLQLAGLGTAFNGLFFGYNGTSFGIMKRSGGVSEIRRLEITTAFNASATIVVTLNGTAFNVNVVNASSSLEFSAHQVEESGTYTGWDVEHAGAYIYFISQTDGVKSGTYSVDWSTSGGAGTFSQLTAGVTKTETWVYQDDFNVDKMDGTGKSLMTIDPQKLNVYQIQYQWLGAGAIKFYIENEVTGEFQLIHIIQYANNNTVPSFSNPSLRMLYAIASLGSTTAMSMSMVSFSSFIEGKLIRDDPKFSIQGSKSISTETNIIVMKNFLMYNNVINHSDVLIKGISVSTDGTKTVEVKVYKNGTIGTNVIGDYTNYVAVDSTNSNTYYDTSTNCDTISNGLLIYSFDLAKSDSATLDLSNLGIILLRGETLTITATSSASNDVSATVSFVEDH